MLFPSGSRLRTLTTMVSPSLASMSGAGYWLLIRNMVRGLYPSAPRETSESGRGKSMDEKRPTAISRGEDKAISAGSGWTDDPIVGGLKDS
jgi:hypothetical protein